MTFLSLIAKNLKFYRKPWLTILSGTMISTAVLTGALVVGDSVRYSLDQLTEMRLGKTHFAIQPRERFFRQQLAVELSGQLKTNVVPVLQLEGIAVNNTNDSRINRVEVLGIDDRFMKLWNNSAGQPTEDEAILNRNTAEKLKLKPGDEFILKIHKQSKASENAPFVSDKEPLVTFRLKVTAIADDGQMGRFSLKSNQSAPNTIFISLPAMARKAELEGNANLMLIAGIDNNSVTSQKIDSALRLCWQPDDAGLVFKPLPGSLNYEIRSDRIFIDDQAAKAISISVPGAEPVLTYLVNALTANGKSTPYSFVTAADFDNQLPEKEILISTWLAGDLGVKPGDFIQLRYFKMGALRKLTEDSARFCVRTILPVTNPVFDRTLMPDFPGMTDAGNCHDWKTGAPVDMSKIRAKDEQYWNNYRGTPKAFISVAAGQKIWDNAFGHATAFRFQADSSGIVKLKNGLMSRMLPSENGLGVRDVYTEGKVAAARSTDFGSLFLSLSFFIIVAALLLSALLFSLHAQKRMVETAILATLGFRKKDIVGILFAEAAIVVVAGSFAGMVSGVFYNKLLLIGLNTLWNDAVRTSMLQVHIVPATLITGFIAGVITALMSLLFVLIRNLRKPLSVSVKGIGPALAHIKSKRKTISLAITILFALSAILMIVYSVFTSQGDPTGIFLTSGGFLIVAGIALLDYLLIKTGQKPRSSVPGFYTLVLRNVCLKKSRTLTAISLLAIGIFTVIITGANRKTFYGTENSRQSGTGGFLFWAESTVPILDDLNTPKGKSTYGLSDEKTLQTLRYTQILSLAGNDASCLNLNQVAQPRILGINPALFDSLQSFSFDNLHPSVNSAHPWSILNNLSEPGIVPAFADQTVITWGMKKKVGDTLLYTAENGKILKVVIMGGLANSVFQGNILVSAGAFSRYFSSTAGSEVMLVDGDFIQRSAIRQRLEYLFQDYGIVITPCSERLAEFNSVTNTYLSVFMLLSGLAMLIGTLGLGIVLLRSLAERKQEFALYRALGFTPKYIRKLIYTENLFILLSGIGLGLLAAITGIMPSFFSTAFHLPATFLALTLLVIFLSGLAWIWFPVKAALRKNVTEAFRQE